MSRERPERRTDFLGLHFNRLAKDEAIMHVEQLAQAPRFSYIVTPNVDHLVQLHRSSGDTKLWSSYTSADLCLCDSRILQALAGVSKIDLQLVPGSDLTADLLGQTATCLKTVAVVGGSEKMLADLSRRFPQFAWQHHIAPMGVMSNPRAQEDIINFIEATAADLVFFAIGAPQSELLCLRLAERQRARGVALCIGASLEFITGTKMRAPPWMQRLMLEWLFRLCAEPHRLGRRYLVDGPRIFKIWYHWQRRRSGTLEECDSNRPNGI